MKIHPISELGLICEKLKEDGNSIALCHGCFDLLHIGHIRHLKAARELSDILIVTVTADNFVNKGANRPAFPEDERAEMLEALECVDYVGINNAVNSSDIILLLKPDFYVKGVDYIGSPPDVEQLAVQKIGGKVIFTTTEKHSSTDLIERFMQ